MPTSPQASGIASLGSDWTLTAAYERCRLLHAHHGRTYYLATMLLPRWKRRHIHALYALTRYADELVDDVTVSADAAQRRRVLTSFAADFAAALAGEPCHHPILTAVVHTIHAFGIPRADFDSFFASMAMDTERDGYDTYDDLLSYMEGSAAVIGTMTLPVLEAADPAAAREPARQLGFAFQLTNFIRDVGEDLGRGRVYLPREDLRAHGLTAADLAARRHPAAVAELLRFEIARAREHYRLAEPGIAMLAASSRPCVRTAFRLYGDILGRVEAAGYDILDRRVSVPLPRRLTVAAGAALAGRAAVRSELAGARATPAINPMAGTP
ncbi:phytoene synthase [Allocatelliglobosispora scoriae]|uniref:Phytoene synthase n=1 Tax=Allocatelliglobosispora scoriae TaxID=643052 RepID=A0A841BPQ6_9ACTN|nr:phytoene/squalene synthase family protein [Allocatelliglobosispora scoriae]MBB5868732.1 phytoene synthase [Allocatelliglobosispora scoriae]